MRILVFGAGVIGSVYAANLLRASHEVTLLARGRRLEDLRTHGLILDNAESGQREVWPVAAVDAPAPDGEYDLVLVAVQAEQFSATLPVLAALRDSVDVLFFGNTIGQSLQLRDALGRRALFGFPAVAGARHGDEIRYGLVNQQQTMLGEIDGTISDRVRRLRTIFRESGFSTTISTDITGWLIGHTAFVVPIAFALYRAGTDPARLAADRHTLRLMVRATRQAFRALGEKAQMPLNLRTLYRLPTAIVAGYWSRALAGPAANCGSLGTAAPHRRRCTP
ncbi:MAG: 2-dehydropantoate 2-reductase N-terminal domain-containing protein [Antricoccus sp.]